MRFREHRARFLVFTVHPVNSTRTRSLKGTPLTRVLDPVNIAHPYPLVKTAPLLRWRSGSIQ
jgi:hypothetical protein